MDIKLLVGQNIRSVRRYQDLTQEELAAAVNLSRASIANIEAGKQGIGVDNLYDIAVALNIPIGMLFDGAEGKTNIVEDINVKYKMLEIKQNKMEKKHKKIIETLTVLIKENK